MSALLGAVIATAALRGTLTFGDRTESRFRNDPISGVVTDFETTPSANLLLADRRVDFTATYGPRLTLLSINATPTPQVFQRLALGLAWHDRRTRVAVSEDVSYGSQSYVSLIVSPTTGTTPGINLQRFTTAQTFRYVSERGTVTLAHQLSRRWRLTSLFDYSVSGGVNADAQTAIPLQKGPRGEVTVDHRLSTRDSVGVILRASYLVTLPGGITVRTENTMIDLLASYRRLLARDLEGTLSAGLSELAAKIDVAPVKYTPYVLVETTLRKTFASQHLDLRLSGRLSPFVDRLTGLVDYQLQASTSLAYTPWSLRKGYSVRGQFGLAQSVPGDKINSVTLLLAELVFSARTSTHVQFDMGGRFGSQNIRNVPAGGLAGTSAPSWALFLGVTFTSLPQRF